MTQTEAIKLAIEWIEKQPEETPHSKYDVDTRYVVLRELEAALAQPEQEPVNKYCCHFCFSKSGQMFLDRMIRCHNCGNKRCPKATSHELPCTNSNEPNQSGSIYTTPPQPVVNQSLTTEPVAFIDEQGTLRYYKPSDFNQCEYGGLVRLYKEKT